LRAFPGAEDAAFAGEVEGGVVSLGLQKAHHLFAEREGFVGVVGNTQLHERVVPAHDAEADFPGGFGGVVDVFDRVAIHLDNVVEEADTLWDDLSQALPVQARPLAAGPDEAGEVERAEVAGLVGEQRLFAARVGGLYRSEVGSWIVAVDAVDEDDAGVAVLPGVGDDEVEDVPRALAAGDHAVLRVDELVLIVALDGLHEVLGDGDGDVEVGQRAHVRLEGDELLDVGVSHREDAHIGAAAGAALLDRLSGGVEHFEERDGAGGDTHRGTHAVPARTQAGEGEAGAAAGLVDDGGLLDRFEDAGDAVRHRKDEAGGELLDFAAGVHQRWRVGQEVELLHEGEKTVFPLGGG
jgi:hypothetical protein